MTNSSPWYRWPKEIDGLPGLSWVYPFKMVDLSMAILNNQTVFLVGGWALPLWKIWRIVSWDDDIPFPTVSGKSFKIPWFQTTNQMVIYLMYPWLMDPPPFSTPRFNANARPFNSSTCCSVEILTAIDPDGSTIVHWMISGDPSDFGNLYMYA